MPIQQNFFGVGNPAGSGQVEFIDHPGGQAQSWTVPGGVTSVSMVLVGGGAGADGGNNGGGGGLTWINNVPVTPGTNLTVYNGKTGSRFGSGSPSGSDTNGQNSYVLDANNLVIAQADGGRKNASDGGPGEGGTSSLIGSNYQSLTYGGGNGGAGNAGSTGKGGGGGAGGYNGNGGNGGSQCGNGQTGNGGGGGGGGGHCTTDGGQGGGVGIYGQGSDGSQGQSASYGGPGGGGSGGGSGSPGYGSWNEVTGAFGGGCGAGSGGAGRGAVRIIWPGDERFFPNTRTANEGEVS